MSLESVDGYYEGEISTWFRRGTVTVRIAGGKIDGVTSLGVPLKGTLWFDEVRKTYRFDVTAFMPPFHVAITGLKTGAQGRAARYSGEAVPMSGMVRFSVDFVGKAIDVALERLGPPEMGDRHLPPAT